jgi:hypothetical protein
MSFNSSRTMTWDWPNGWRIAGWKKVSVSKACGIDCRRICRGKVTQDQVNRYHHDTQSLNELAVGGAVNGVYQLRLTILRGVEYS